MYNTYKHVQYSSATVDCSFSSNSTLELLDLELQDSTQQIESEQVWGQTTHPYAS